MTKTTSILFLGLVFSNFLFAQKVEITTKAIEDNRIQIIIQNKTKLDQSVELDCKLDGMTASESLPKTQFVRAGAEAVFVTLSPKDIYKAHSFGTSIRYVEGNVMAAHDDDFIYRLPYPKGKTYKVDQGYLGNKTHQNQYALDFNMNTGSEIAAIRDGVVSKVEDKNDRGCPSENCNPYNNYIIITHEDGSIADYSHLKKRGAKVKVGDQVKAGDIIGLSGATGWASGPHLHLEVYTVSWNKHKTIEAKYYLGKGEVGIPKEGMTYKKID
ncbi:MAG: peptidoglycan DD-metalloendopeptidase family protein [Cyclobacteriaceae bacterium]